MTPAARFQAAAEILDRILAGAAAEQALTSWARASRFAGSKDRAAIRDQVFDVLRCKRSFAHLGGQMTGRGLILGALRADGQDPATVFTGQGHAPAPLSVTEAKHVPTPMPELVALDCPDWIAPELRYSLGPDFSAVLKALRHRAPVFLRVNTARIARDAAADALHDAGIATSVHPLADTVLQVTANARALQRAAPYLDGMVELQDASSQAVIAALPDLEGTRVLDYCAGGGGKALAMAARGADVTAHDAQPRRMKDLPARAARAHAQIGLTEAPHGEFDLVLADVPCSGTGAWRRTPGAKWTLAASQLSQLHVTQAKILDQITRHVRPGGWLAYATCSLLYSENQAQIDAFLQRHPGFAQTLSLSLTPLTDGDGFFIAILKRHLV